MSEQFRTSGQIPICIARARVTKVSRKHGQQKFNLLSGSISVQQCLHSETVAKIVQTRPGVIRDRSKSYLARQSPKYSIYVLQEQPATPLSNKEKGASWWIEMSIASLSVTLQNRSCSAVDGNQSGFTELGIADRQDTTRQIDILSAKVERLADPHAGNSQESEKAVMSPAAQRLRGRQGKGCRQQIADLLLGV
jgi:hypothetical protein